MRGFIFVAEAATVHPDNTFSVLRGGLDKLLVSQGEDGPVVVHGTAVVRAVASSEDVGEHRLTIRVLAPGGAAVIEQTSNPFTISESGQKFNSIVGFSFPAEAMGRYYIVISVNGQNLDEYPFDVEAE